MKALLIAEVTLREALRRRIVLAAAIVTLGFVALYTVGVWFGFRELQADPDMGALEQRAIVGVLLSGGMWSLNFVVSLLAIFLAVGSISGEVAQGTLHAVVARPARRWEIVLGKFAGQTLMMAGFVAVSSAAMLGAVRLITGQLAERAWIAPFLMLFAAIVLIGITTAGSARFGTLVNGVTVFTLYAAALVGGVIEQIGVFLDSVVMFDIGVGTSFFMPTRALWDMASAQFAPPGSSALSIDAGPFGSLNGPSGWMLLVAGVHVVLMLAIAVRVFQRRDL